MSKLSRKKVYLLIARILDSIDRSPCEEMDGNGMLQQWSRAGVGKLSSQMHLSLWNAISCPRSRHLSLVTSKGGYAILALLNYKMQAEKRY